MDKPSSMPPFVKELLFHLALEPICFGGWVICGIYFGWLAPLSLVFMVLSLGLTVRLIYVVMRMNKADRDKHLDT